MLFCIAFLCALCNNYYRYFKAVLYIWGDKVETLYIIGQALGIVVMLVSIFNYTLKKRKQILSVKLALDLVSIVQNIFISAFTGAALCFVNSCRGVVFLNRERHRWARHGIWFFVFVALICTLSVFTWAGWYSLFAMLGSIAATVGFYCLNPKLTRILGIIGVAFFNVYSVATLNIGSIIGNTLAVVIGTGSLIIEEVNKRRKKQNGDGEKRLI